MVAERTYYIAKSRPSFAEIKEIVRASITGRSGVTDVVTEIFDSAPLTAPVWVRDQIDAAQRDGHGGYVVMITVA